MLCGGWVCSLVAPWLPWSTCGPDLDGEGHAALTVFSPALSVFWVPRAPCHECSSAPRGGTLGQLRPEVLVKLSGFL